MAKVDRRNGNLASLSRWTPLILALGKLRQEDCCQFEARLGHISSTKLAKAIHYESCL